VVSFVVSVVIMIAVVGTLSGWMLRRDARDRVREDR
jgi:putative effector of murein hydrolase LrgA (UPF0299 family)